MAEKQRQQNNRSSQRSSQRRRRDRSRKPKVKFTNKISEHFSKRDFVCKESEKFKISLGLVGALEELRSAVQKRITIVKGFEDPDVAEAKGSLKRNFHTQGLADISVEDMDPKELFKAAESIETFTGIGLNLEEAYVHVDTRKADRLTWVEEKGADVPLTDENRKTYIGA